MKKIFSVIVWLLLAAVFTVGPMTLAQADPYDDAAKVYVAKDYPKAFEMFKKLAELENPDAQVQLGWMYTYGKGVARDEKEGLKWCKSSVVGTESELIVISTMLITF